MNRRLLLQARTAGALSALVPLLLAGCAPLDREPVSIDGDWPAYESLDELWEQATLVVEARLGDAPEVELYELPGVPEASYPIAIHDATVMKSWKGEVREGSIIKIKEAISAEIGGVEYQLADEAPLDAGRTYLLFLNTYPDATPGVPAGLLNPWQGRYLLDVGSSLLTDVNAPDLPSIEVTFDDLEELDPLAGDQDLRLSEGYLPGSG